MPLFYSHLTYIEEGLAKLGTLVCDSDGSLISNPRDQNSIELVVSVSNYAKADNRPATGEIAKVYVQAASFFQVDFLMNSIFKYCIIL